MHKLIINIALFLLLQNPVVGAKKIAEFLGLNLDDEDICGVAERSTFKAMKDKSKTTHGEFGAVLFRKGNVLKVLLKQLGNLPS